MFFCKVTNPSDKYNELPRVLLIPELLLTNLFDFIIAVPAISIAPPLVAVFVSNIQFVICRLSAL